MAKTIFVSYLFELSRSRSSIAHAQFESTAAKWQKKKNSRTAAETKVETLYHIDKPQLPKRWFSPFCKAMKGNAEERERWKAGNGKQMVSNRNWINLHKFRVENTQNSYCVYCSVENHFWMVTIRAQVKYSVIGSTTMNIVHNTKTLFISFF